MFAKKIEDFIPYLDYYTGPPFSFSWATISGDIGYTPISYFPYKKKSNSNIFKGL